MTGTLAERNLLASVIADSRVYRMTEGLVTEDDFTDPRMGKIYTQIGDMLAKREPVGMIEVADKFPEWGIRGLSFVDVASWETPDTYAMGASAYATTVRGDAMRRHAQEVAQMMLSEARDIGVQPVEVLSKARQMLDERLDGASTGKLVPKTLGEILEGEDTYDWIIPGLLERQDRIILTGAEGAGKTTFARQVCVMSAAGLHPLNRVGGVPEIIQPVRVLVIDAENTEKQWRRATRAMVRHSATSGVLDPGREVQVVAGHRIDITRGAHLGEVHRLIDIHQPDLLYIGPLYKITNGAIQTDDDAAPLLVALDSLRERGIALLMEAHAAKGDGHGNRDLRPRGSAALMGWPEFGLGLQPVDEQTVDLVRWRGDRDKRSWPKQLVKGVDWPWERG